MEMELEAGLAMLSSGKGGSSGPGHGQAVVKDARASAKPAVEYLAIRHQPPGTSHTCTASLGLPSPSDHHIVYLCM